MDTNFKTQMKSKIMIYDGILRNQPYVKEVQDKMQLAVDYYMHKTMVEVVGIRSEGSA